jgi:hypothetical protein
VPLVGEVVGVVVVVLLHPARNNRLPKPIDNADNLKLSNLVC